MDVHSAERFTNMASVAWEGNCGKVTQSAEVVFRPNFTIVVEKLTQLTHVTSSLLATTPIREAIHT
jgi:hypothetical protein